MHLLIRFGIVLGITVGLGARGSQAATSPISNACISAGTSTNAVIRFYLAVDQRRYASAYRCLATSEQQHIPYPQFKQGYAHTISSHLVFANSEVPYGAPVDHVTIDLHAIDAHGSHLIATTYMGRWRVDASNQLAQGAIHVTRTQSVHTIPTTNVGSIFSFAQQEILARLHVDVTGDGIADDIYTTAGIGCGSCHSQQVWIFSQNRLIFEQQADNAEVRIAHTGLGFELRTTTPGASGPDCCPSERTYEEWVWTPFGFTLQGQHIVHTH